MGVAWEGQRLAALAAGRRRSQEYGGACHCDTTVTVAVYQEGNSDPVELFTVVQSFGDYSLRDGHRGREAMVLLLSRRDGSGPWSVAGVDTGAALCSARFLLGAPIAYRGPPLMAARVITI